MPSSHTFPRSLPRAAAMLLLGPCRGEGWQTYTIGMTLGQVALSPEPASSSIALPSILNLTEILPLGAWGLKARGQGLGTWGPAQLPGHGQMLKLLPALYPPPSLYSS